MAPSSGGKSTLIRSLLIDFEKNNPGRKVLIILSEEYVDELQDELADTGHLFSGNIFALSEKDLIKVHKNAQMMWLFLGEIIANMKPDLVIYDNITTSDCYNEKRPDEQQKFIMMLEDLPGRSNYSLLIVAHSGKKINNNQSKLMSSNDIRGTSNLTNRAQFFYILHSWYVEDNIFSFITIEKCRGFNRPTGAYSLEYSRERRVFIWDQFISRDDLSVIGKKKSTL